MNNKGQIGPREPSATGLLPPQHRRSVLFFCAATFFYWASLYLYVPILPVYIQSLGASLSMVGIIVASYAIPQLLLRIPIGVWSDVLGRKKPFVVGGIIMTAVGALGLGLAPGPWLLFLARIATGIGAASWVTFAVYFTTYYPRERMGHAIGTISFIQWTAIVLATSGGGAIAEVLGSGYTFYGAALLGIISLFVVFPAGEPETQRAETVSWNSFTRVATSPLLLLASSMSILLQFVSFAGVFGFIPIYGAEIGASSADLGIITMLSVGSTAVASLAAAPLTERWGSRLTVIAGAVLVGISLLAIPFIHSVWVLEAVQVVYGFGRGVLGTTFMALSIHAVAPRQRATAMGVYQAIYSLGMMLGPLLSGFLADSQGLAAVFYLSSSVCLVIIGLACLPVLSSNRRQLPA